MQASTSEGSCSTQRSSVCSPTDSGAPSSVVVMLAPNLSSVPETINVASSLAVIESSSSFDRLQSGMSRHSSSSDVSKVESSTSSVVGAGQVWCRPVAKLVPLVSA